MHEPGLKEQKSALKKNVLGLNLFGKYSTICSDTIYAQNKLDSFFVLDSDFISVIFKRTY